MEMNKAQLRALVIDNTGRTDKSTTINTALDFALQSMCRIYPFDSLRKEGDIPINAGDTQAQLPSIMFQITEARLVDPGNPTFSYSMEIMRKNVFVKMYPNVAGMPITSRPFRMYKDGHTIFFDCIANNPYIIRVTGFSLDVFNSDVSSPLLYNADEVLVAYATANVYRSIQMYDDANVWDMQFKKLFNLFVSSEEKDVGRERIARPWKNPDQTPRNNVIPPWLDPFAGQHEN